MKRIAALLIALLLAFSACAFALSDTNYPAWDGVSTPENSLYGSIDSKNLLLGFDAGADYSNVAGGFIQACFFAFDSAEQNYLEMYLLLPETAAAGDVFSSTGASMSSISLYEVSKDSDVLYFAGQIAGLAYPEGSNYELRITSAEKSATTLSMSGTLSGTLIKFAGDQPAGEALRLDGVNFSFKLPLSGASISPKTMPTPETSTAPFQTPENSPLPFQTQPPQAAPSSAPVPAKATMDPHPAFTLPPDYALA